MVAFAGLGVPVVLTPEQRAMISPKFDFLEGGSKPLQDWFISRVLPSLQRPGSDPTTCFRRCLPLLCSLVPVLSFHDQFSRKLCF